MKFYLRDFRGNEIYIYRSMRVNKLKVVHPFRGYTFKPFTIISRYFSGTVYEPNVKLLPRIAYYQ